MMFKGRRIPLRLATLVASLLLAGELRAQFYHGMHHPFGKNRIQYEQFDWMKYEFDHFTVFFYGRNKNLAVFTAKNAGEMIDEMEQFFDYSMKRERTQFVVYQKLEHFRQSNVGIPETDESNIGGTTQIAGSKIFVYFDGDLNSYRQQIREGIAEVLIGQMLFGENWREMIKNNALINFPQWFTAGLTKYAARPWDIEADDRLRDLVYRDRYKKFNRLGEEDAAVAGRSLWYYIGETYGTNVIPNIMYMARVTRSIESGFLFVLGISMETLLEDAQRYFEMRYASDREGTQDFEPFLYIRSRKGRDFTEPRISPDGRYLAYATNVKSKMKVFIYDASKDRKRKRYRQGHKLDHIYDTSYPVMDWNPVTGELHVIVERRGRLWMHRIDPKEGETGKIELLRLEKVLDMSFSPDGKQILFSAINGGQTDIYLYSIAANSQKQLTADIYDDRYPVFLNEEEVLFASNRANDTIDLAKDNLSYAPLPTMDIYKLPVEDGEVAMNLTQSPTSNERKPLRLNNTSFMFESDESGIRNRYFGQMDSAIVSIDTAITYRYYARTEALTGYPRNLTGFDYEASEEKLVELFLYDGGYSMQIKEGDEVTQPFLPVNSNFKQNELIDQAREERAERAAEPLQEDTLGITIIRKKVFDQDAVSKSIDDGTINIFDYQFDEESMRHAAKDNGESRNKVLIPRDSIKQDDDTPFVLPVMRNYDLAFAATDLTTQMDFDYATDLYQPFNGGPFINPGLGTFLKVGMLDVFEDYKLEGGFRYSFNSDGTEYFISLEDRSRRLDRKYILQRQALTTIESLPLNQRVQIYQARGIFRYPIDEVQSVQLTATGRYDRLITLGQDRQGLEQDDETDFWGGVKLEYIFDNTLDMALNIRSGTRLKVFGEHYRNIVDPSSSLYVTGLDLRNYIPIHRELIWANRLAGSSSFGPQKLVYYMGSVDNWIILGNRERFDFGNDVSRTQGYRFQTIATNMRGFVQNARNGNNFGVLNSELRWPVVRYFTNKPLKSEFLSTFQVIGFADVGTAWTGVSPYSEENAFNRITETNGSVTVTYENQTDPFIGGVGWGLRAKVWGYFVRFDYAWGIENGLFLNPTTHLSFGLDF